MPPKRQPTTTTSTSNTASTVRRTLRPSKATAATTVAAKKAVAASTTTTTKTRGTKRKLEAEAEVEVEERVVIQQEGDEDVVVKPRLVIKQDGDEDVVISVAKKAVTKTTTTTKRTPAKRGKAETKKTPAKRTPAKRVKIEVEEVVVKAEVNATPKKPATVKPMPTPAKTPAKTRTGTLDAFLAGTLTPKKTPKKPSGTLDDFVLRTPVAVREETPVEETPVKTSKKPSGNLDDFVTRTPTAAIATPTPKKPSGKLDSFVAKTSSSPLKQRAGNEDTQPEDAEAEDLPESLTCLIRFHGSLLTALLLHKAQNSSGIFPSFAAMKPHIERLTSKRVSLEDIRKIVFLSHYNLPSDAKGGLELIDYGAGKTVVKFVETASTKLIHSESLKTLFRQQVREFHAHLGADAAVPLAQIHEHLHRTTINTVLHGKSQQLIKELKAVPKKSTITFTAKKAAASTRSSGLIERIRAKAAAAEKPPTPEELLRRAAGDRVGEVREILRGCRAKGGSLGLRAAVEKVRESVKNPIGADEAELAVKLVAEMEPWCDVRISGGVGAVVFGGWEGEGLFA
ncbi:hypothetical protein BZA05DRAFT_385469 [Tricharina praecox]|uniref:uncharacterized protein n=1 Tax=Tricharina praecox TaxID=43433 RepID=UPI0022212047|nr:uncharacterized protein BZA05DRAFT_385469 [Tricharina praecox]KAI5857984.1 hypothetical protein BZA05DRAFT_385469 [Tricharina praecox]